MMVRSWPQPSGHCCADPPRVYFRPPADLGFTRIAIPTSLRRVLMSGGSKHKPEPYLAGKNTPVLARRRAGREYARERLLKMNQRFVERVSVRSPPVTRAVKDHCRLLRPSQSGRGCCHSRGVNVRM
jgi:hypothetical protein